MTDKKINKTIAELCRWEIVGDEVFCYANNDIRGFRWFTGDSDAMKEVLLTLTDGQRTDLLWHLDDMGVGNNGDFALLTLHPEVLAEAFLRTLGKWEQ